MVPVIDSSALFPMMHIAQCHARTMLNRVVVPQHTLFLTQKKNKQETPDACECSKYPKYMCIDRILKSTLFTRCCFCFFCLFCCTLSVYRNDGRTFHIGLKSESQSKCRSMKLDLKIGIDSLRLQQKKIDELHHSSI